MKSNLPISLAAAVLMILAGTAQAQFIVSTPIAVTGFSGDVIYGPALGDMTANATISGFNLVSVGQGNEGTGGLPDNGTIDSASQPVEFQLQPYNVNNVLTVVGAATGTLTLVNPAAYLNVSILIQNQNYHPGQTPASFTLNFSDLTSTTYTTTGVIPYWTGGDATASGGSTALNDNAIYDNGSPTYFFEYDFVLSSTDALKNLSSFTISNTGGGYLDLYALSGQSNPDAPEPSTYAMMIAGLGLLALGVRLSRNRTALRI